MKSITQSDESITQRFRPSRLMLSCYHSMVCPSVCPSVTFMHPAEAVGRNEMPFGRDTRVVPISNTALDRGPSPPQEAEILGSKPPVKICIANCGQTVTDSGMVTMDSPIKRYHRRPHKTSLPLNSMFAAMPPSAKRLWPLLLLLLATFPPDGRERSPVDNGLGRDARPIRQ